MKANDIKGHILCPGELQMRKAGSQQEGEEPRLVTGYAIRFNELSVPLWGDFREQIASSCVTEEWLRECDIKMTLFHNREKLLARWNKGEGSLRLSVDDHGVAFEFEAPNTELGNFLVEGVSRNDITGCSFTFVPRDYMLAEVQEGDESYTLVTHTKFERLFEMTIGTDPAYPTTSVECEFERNLEDAVSLHRKVEADRRRAQELRLKATEYGL